MHAILKSILTAVAFAALLWTPWPPAHATDLVRFLQPDSGIDHRGDFGARVLYEALRRTERKYGPFEIRFEVIVMDRARQFEVLKEGATINVMEVPSSRDWEQQLPHVPIPIDLGLQSWRIALVTEQSRERLRAVQSLGELKGLRVGVGNGWISQGIFKNEGFNVVSGNNFNGLFAMLAAERFDYLPRSIRDVYDELENRKLQLPTLAVDDSLLIYLPLPSYFFIAPGAPRIEQRLRAGMMAMLKDGSLKRMVLAYHRDMIQRAGICARKLFVVGNPEVEPAVLARKDLWLDLLDPRNGICARKSNP